MVRNLRDRRNTIFFSDGKRGIHSCMAARVKPTINTVVQCKWSIVKMGQGLIMSGPSTAAYKEVQVYYNSVGKVLLLLGQLG